MAVTEALENYLETILVLTGKKAGVHAVDICAELGYSRPTVSEALKNLKLGGYVEVDDDHHITLTSAGREIALGMLDRHNTLTKMLMFIGVSKETAVADACKIEHDLSDETINCIKKYFDI